MQGELHLLMAVRFGYGSSGSAIAKAGDSAEAEDWSKPHKQIN